MQKPYILEDDVNRVLASINTNGKDAPNNSNPLPEGEPEEFDIYVEPDRITVVKRPEPEAQVIDAARPPQRQQPPYFAYIAMTMSLLLIFSLITSAIITVFFPPIATITIIPKSKIISLTGTLQLGRLVRPITISQSQTAQTTGKGHQTAKQAHGFITFYNGQFQSVTVAAGTILTGADGIEIITVESATLPAANPPIFGQTTVSAHAIMAGGKGNIAAYDINEACCAQSVLAKNIYPFTGGQDERSFTVVTQKDINTVAATLQSSLSLSMHGALAAQVKQPETLITLPCSPIATPNHSIGEEATQVKVTVSVTCSGIAYDTKSLETKVRALLSTQAIKKLGSGYSLFGNIQVSVKQATVTRTTTPLVFLSFQAQGTWIYALPLTAREHIKELIAGKTKQQALHVLSSLPGIERAVISWGDDTRLPKDTGYIHIRLLVV